MKLVSYSRVENFLTIIKKSKIKKNEVKEILISKNPKSSAKLVKDLEIGDVLEFSIDFIFGEALNYHQHTHNYTEDLCVKNLRTGEILIDSPRRIINRFENIALVELENYQA